MNRLFNAQNPGDGLYVDLVFTRETSCKFIDRSSQQEISQQMALKGESFRVIPYNQKAHTQHYGNYRVFYRDTSSVVLHLSTRKLRLRDPFWENPNTLTEYTLLDYWLAHFKRGSPVYSIKFTDTEVALTTLWENKMGAREFRLYDGDSGFVEEIYDVFGNYIGSGSSYVDDMIKATLSVPPYTVPYHGIPGWGLNTWFIQDSQGGEKDIKLPFSFNFTYESHHIYQLLLDEGHGYSRGEITSAGYSGEDWYTPTPFFAENKSVTDTVRSQDNYYDIDLVELYQGAVPSEEGIKVIKGTPSSWVTSAELLNLTTNPTLRVRFKTMAALTTNQVTLVIIGTDYNNQVPFTTRLNLTLKTI